MNRIQKVATGLFMTVLVLGMVELLTPVTVSAPPVQDPNCKRSCPLTKKHNGFTCTFAGCDPVTGNCLYAC